MSGPAVDFVYRYAYLSAMRAEPFGPELRLATFGGPEEHPYFFQGELMRPKRVADLLRGVMAVVQSRFHVPAAMLGRILGQSDPVVTSSDDRLRFEGFSGCCSTYVRVDLLPEAVQGRRFGRGTTNVDFNSDMMAALARIREGDKVALAVGRDSVRLSREQESVVEKKVTMPVRWLKGFVEVQAYQARMIPVLEVSGLEARRFLRSLPRSKTRHPVSVTAAGTGLRLSHVPTATGVAVCGLERLRILESLSQHATKLRIYADADSGTSGWELVLEDARFHLVLSPSTWRGFSGEGQALSGLATEDWKKVLPRIQKSLRWESVIDIGGLSRQTGATPDTIRGALSALGARGLVGFDLEAGSYFHRELPFDLSTVEALQPRLQNARKLVEQGKVKIASAAADRVEVFVEVSTGVHRVSLTDASEKCTCPWFAKHQGKRGPCKHVLAAQLVLEAERAE